MKPQVEFLLSAKHLVFYGLTRRGYGFSHDVFNAVRQFRNDLPMTIVHPEMPEFAEAPVVINAQYIQPPPDKAMIVLGPSDAATALKDAALAGIKSVWLVQNAADVANLELAAHNKISVVRGCPLLFIPGLGFPHNWHRAVAHLFGNV